MSERITPVVSAAYAPRTMGSENASRPISSSVQ